MIPSNCVNCEWGTPMNNDADNPVPCICGALPVDTVVRDGRSKRCSMFAMAQQPRWIVPDNPPEGQGGPISGQETLEPDQDTANGVPTDGRG